MAVMMTAGARSKCEVGEDDDEDQENEHGLDVSSAGLHNAPEEPPL
jgi:hypothetical protein